MGKRDTNLTPPLPPSPTPRKVESELEVVEGWVDEVKRLLEDAKSQLEVSNQALPHTTTSQPTPSCEH